MAGAFQSNAFAPGFQIPGAGDAFQRCAFQDAFQTSPCGQPPPPPLLLGTGGGGGIHLDRDDWRYEAEIVREDAEIFDIIKVFLFWRDRI